MTFLDNVDPMPASSPLFPRSQSALLTRQGTEALLDPPSALPGMDPANPYCPDVETVLRQARWLHIRRLWIFRIKKYFLAFHYAYILLVALLGGLVIWQTEDLHVLDALFISVSGVTCTGLFSAATNFTTPGNVAWHICVILGGTVFTSVVPCLLRIATLRLLDELEADTTTVKRTEHRRKLFVTSTIMTGVSMTYWALWHCIGMVLYLTHYDFPHAVMRTVSSFNNSGFLITQPGDFNSQTVSLLAMCFLIPAGSTLFPVFLRPFVICCREVFRACLTARRAYARWYHRRRRSGRIARGLDPDGSSSEEGSDGHGSDAETPLLTDVAGESGPLLTVVPEAGLQGSMSDGSDTGFQNRSMLGLPPELASPELNSEWLQGFDFILLSSKPVNHHPWLFVRNDTLYILIAFGLIVAFQFAPYLWQQWDVTLGDQSNWAMKLLLALTQVISDRFAGIGLVNFNRFAPGHLLTIIFALYIPALPIPTERTRRKWKEMFSGGFMRLFSSRFWWLFIATMVIIFFEESRSVFVHDSRHPWDHGITVRVLFEVMSAYATSGLTVALQHSPSSLSSSFCAVSKVIIMLCMLAGRHRNMDLGLDIGLTELEAESRPKREEAVEASLRRRATIQAAASAAVDASPYASYDATRRRRTRTAQQSDTGDLLSGPPAETPPKLSPSQPPLGSDVSSPRVTVPARQHFE